ncbi:MULTISPECIES: Yip1 family protein [unclassified Paenibacillus]|uniref:Yip1 family protein n=1 Tax=unclassified Paenibacillus TaxID=185978 RepID=UPI0007E3E981|nr:Yip1 family protein [Paenibacillus sp. AD87]OAX48535.1 hypothetical protein gpAD87_10205 [Paenibacillus sp. AD87]
MNRELVKHPFYLIMHPYNGFWDLKYERSQKTNLIISFVILFLMVITNVMQREYSGFLVNFSNPQEMNSLLEVIYIMLPLVYWCVANWSLTTLMDGEGKFVEIFISTCFALIPMVLINLPWVGLSNLIANQETVYYHFSGSIAILWSLYLLFVGNMTVHQYSPSKTIGTLILSVVAMAFLAFLTLLFFSLIQQIISFISTIYQEIVLRS